MTKPFYSSPVLLAIRLRQLGDVLATLGTLRAIKDASPDTTIAFIVDGHYHPLLRGVPFIDMLLTQPPSFRGFGNAVKYSRYIEQLRVLRADYALDFHCNVRSAIITYLSGAPVRIGFDVRGRKLLYTEVEPRATFDNGRIIPRTSHESAMALASRVGGFELRGTVRGTIPVEEDRVRAGREALVAGGLDGSVVEAGDVVALNPGNPYRAKEWPERAFAALARRLVRRGKQVVVVWGPGERDRAAGIAAAAGRDVFVGPERRLDEIPGLLRNVSLLVTIDSGLKHLAVATNVPTVTLFGPTSPEEWHMGGELDRVLSAGLSCSPCRLLACPFGTPCMRQITPEDVVEAVLEIAEDSRLAAATQVEAG